MKVGATDTCKSLVVVVRIMINSWVTSHSVQHKLEDHVAQDRYDGPRGRQAAVLMKWREAASSSTDGTSLCLWEPDGWAVVEMRVEFASRVSSGTSSNREACLTRLDVLDPVTVSVRRGRPFVSGDASGATHGGRVTTMNQLEDETIEYVSETTREVLISGWTPHGHRSAPALRETAAGL